MDLDREAELFLDSQEVVIPHEPSSPIWTLDDDYIMRQNARIIRAADDFLLERLENGDGSLRTTDVISAKDMAFKQNQKILWLEDGEGSNMIPSTINIQIINN